MSPRPRIVIFLSTLLMTALACEFTPSLGSTPEPDAKGAIATSVAATIAAGEIADSTQGESTDPQPGDVPAPTDTMNPIPPAPSTLKAVYIRNGNLWYWEEGILPYSLTSGGDAYDVQLSDDGSVAAFTRGPDWYHQELWAVNTGGGSLRKLVSQAALDGYITHPDAVSARIYSFAFRPGTHQVAFNTQLTFEGPGLFLNDDLRVVDADTATLSTVLSPGSGGNFTYSPDGSKVGLVTADQVSLVNPDGTGRVDLLSFPVVITYSEYNYYPPFSWMPDGSAIRVVIPPEDPLAPSPDITRIYHLPVDGSGPTVLTGMVPVPFFQSTPFLSGNTERVAYLVEITPGSPPNLELHLANIDGSGDMIYATGPLAFHAWGTNGHFFLYTDASPNPKIGEYGIAPNPLTGVSNLISASWVDETRFFFQQKNGSNYELWLGEVGAPSILIDSTPGGMINFDFCE